MWPAAFSLARIRRRFGCRSGLAGAHVPRFVSDGSIIGRGRNRSFGFERRAVHCRRGGDAHGDVTGFRYAVCSESCGASVEN
jgi:hypothetical protein